MTTFAGRTCLLRECTPETIDDVLRLMGYQIVGGQCVLLAGDRQGPFATLGTIGWAQSFPGPAPGAESCPDGSPPAQIPTLPIGAGPPGGGTFPPGEFGDLIILIPPPPESSSVMAVRKWIVGFELPVAGELLSSIFTGRVSRDASRTLEGLGLALRRSGNAQAVLLTNSLGHAPDTQTWERFYLRLRTRDPVATVPLWRALPSIGGGSGPRLSILPTGGLRAENLNDPGQVQHFLGDTTPLDLDVWYRLDLIFTFATGAGVFKLYVNGVELINRTVTTGNTGLSQTQNHLQSRLGNYLGGANTLELDLDDWIGAEHPDPALDSLDWILGSHVSLAHATGFASDHDSVDWSGDWRAALEMAVPLFGGSSTALLTTTVAGSNRIALTTDARGGDTFGFGGIAGLEVHVNTPAIGGVPTTIALGYRINGGAVVTEVRETDIGTWQAVRFSPTGLTAPAALTSLDLILDGSAGSGTRSVRALAATLEHLGVWGAEDLGRLDTPKAYLLPLRTPHNAPYPRSVYAQSSPAPYAPVAVIAGTYVGNNLGQDVLQTIPAHWWWVRNVSNPAARGVRWWSSMIAGHDGLRTTTSADLLHPTMDGQGGAAQPRLRVGGTSIAANVASDTYQWIAVCDPGMRFLLNGAFAHTDTVTGVSNPLFLSSFLPEIAFLVTEGVSGATTAAVWYKGVGMAAATASKLLGNLSSPIVELGTGALISHAALHGTSGDNVAYSCWRRADPGACNDGGLDSVVFDAITYVGNGAASQTIALSLGGRRPLFALVVPHDAVESEIRDPSHTGTASSNAAQTTNHTTGIIAGGINQIEAGILLNKTGITYDVFVIPGGTAGNADGWSLNGTFFPVSPCPGSGWTPLPPMDSVVPGGTVPCP